MDPKVYVEGVLRTESDELYTNGLASTGELRLLHAGMGMCTEAGEFLDQLKKHIFYGKELDKVNLLEEIGDSLWYVGIALDELGSSFEAVMQQNHDKLAKRYKGGAFNKKDATERDLEAERQVLETAAAVIDDLKAAKPTKS